MPTKTDIELFAQIEKLLKSGKQLESMQGIYRPVSDRELIERSLVLANMRTWLDFGYLHAWFELGHGTVEYPLATDGRVQKLGDPTGAGDIARTFADEQIGPHWQDLHLEDYAEYQREQKEFVAVLDAISRNLRAAREKYEPAISKRLDNVLCVGVASFRAGRLHDRARPYLRGIRQAWAYSAALLLDADRPASDPKRSFGERLRRCARGEDADPQYYCGKWFLSYAGEGGGPMKKYCSDECTALAALDASAGRQSKFRSQRRKPK